ncbi:FecR family protein [Marinospirillum perlucidum]|uniref:FecR family protein n=1 Tax=Marinospirillum perlucidum TaxID=1982602 RepID=UPI00138FE50A|nr:FecR family protein [Marinospirillum perlucidum]
MGSFQFVHGDVRIQRGNQTIEANRGDDILAGDTLITAAASSAQLRMVDGARMALRPRTELVVDEYTFNDDEDDSSLVSLTRGGLRTVTGALGKARPERVQIDTPVATMGIRGTDMDTFFLPPPANQNASGNTSPPPQAFLRVNEGTGIIRSGGAEMIVPAGNIAAGGLSQPPRRIPRLPPSIQALDEESTGSETDNEEGSSEEGTTDGDGEASDEEDQEAGGDEEGNNEDQDATFGDGLFSDEELDEYLPTLEDLGLTEEDIRTLNETLKESIEGSEGTTITIQ